MAAISAVVMQQWQTHLVQEGFAAPTRHASISAQETGNQMGAHDT
jgi:hypothetical protein